MISYFENLPHLYQALLAGLFTYALTALGSAVVLTAKNLNRKALDSMLGLSGGIMLATTFWSLLQPAINMSQNKSYPAFLPPLIGLLVGSGFIRLIDFILPHLHLGYPMESAEGLKSSWKQTTLFVLAVTIHNIPEGLAIGVAFGSLIDPLYAGSFASAVALTIGIGIQDIPEGLAISLPLRRSGLSRLKSFWYGQLSGIVEPIAAIIGASVVILSKSILPYALGFAAGAMIYIVIEEVIPESQREGNTDLVTLFTILGFALMMVLEVGLT